MCFLICDAIYKLIYIYIKNVSQFCQSFYIWSGVCPIYPANHCSPSPLEHTSSSPAHKSVKHILLILDNIVNR